MKHLVLVLSLTAGAPAIAVAQQSPPTFYKDVLRVLQQNCQTCHRPNEIGPMPLLTYEEARPWARAIRAAVVSRRMPPWGADRDVGAFHNDPSLSAATIEMLAALGGRGEEMMVGFFVVAVPAGTDLASVVARP